MRNAILVAAAIFSVAAFVPAAPAEARKKLEIALQDDLLFLHRGGARGQYFSRETAFEKMRAFRGSALRVNLIWVQAVVREQQALPQKPDHVNYNWAAYDSLVDLARGYGVKVQFALTGPTPAWATSTGDIATSYIQPNAEYFGEFARAAAEHFQGRVKRYSIWNEPNWGTWLGPLDEGPLLYRELYRQGYRNIKRADRQAQILIGELSPFRKGSSSTAPLKFLRQMTCVNGKYKRTGTGGCSGGALRADGFAHHPYEFKNPPAKAHKGRDNVTIGALGRLTRALDKLKRARVLKPRRSKKMPLYLTEFGYFREGERKISERKRKRWTTQGFDIARKNPRVRQILYYVFVQPPGGTFFDLSMLDYTGAETGLYRALVRWSEKRKRYLKEPGRIRAGVNDENPPPPPGGTPPPGGGGGEEEPPPEEPACPIPFPEGFPCPFTEQRSGFGA